MCTYIIPASDAAPLQVAKLPTWTVSLCLAVDSACTAVGRSTTPDWQSGSRCQINLGILAVLIVLNVSWKQNPLAAASVTSALEVIYTVSQKKLCQLIFCSLSVKYEPISIKIGRIVPEQTLNETTHKLPTSPKVCACTTLGNLKCQIEPSTQ